MYLKGKKILIGITGGIAAYKICELVRLFKKLSAEVRVIMTPSGVHFVSPLTLSVLSGNEVIINQFPNANLNDSENILLKTSHVHLGLWADVLIIAPATANTIAKINHGFADNFLTSTLLSARCPVLIVPAMDEDMYKNEITNVNLSSLREYGYYTMEPAIGELASGLTGIGRMPEPEEILREASNILNGYKFDLKGKKILVTAGPTYEPIDDVRYLGNYSSGKMGFQIANAAHKRGAEVVLISGQTMLKTPGNIHRIDIKTSDEMFNEVKKNQKGKDIIIMAAAVADFKPVKVFNGKIKKVTQENLKIDTEKTTDILSYLGKNKNGSKLVGFALESVNALENAKQKLSEKNLDMVVLNDPQEEGAGFGTDTNIVTIIDKDFNINRTVKLSKFDIANLILDSLANAG